MIVLLQSENRNIEMIATVAGKTNRKKKNKWGYLIVHDEKLSTTTPVIKVLCS